MHKQTRAAVCRWRRERQITTTWYRYSSAKPGKRSTRGRFTLTRAINHKRCTCTSERPHAETHTIHRSKENHKKPKTPPTNPKNTTENTRQNQERKYTETAPTNNKQSTHNENKRIPAQKKRNLKRAKNNHRVSLLQEKKEVRILNAISIIDAPTVLVKTTRQKRGKNQQTPAHTVHTPTKPLDKHEITNLYQKPLLGNKTKYTVKTRYRIRISVKKLLRISASGNYKRNRENFLESCEKKLADIMRNDWAQNRRPNRYDGTANHAERLPTIRTDRKRI